MTEEENKEKFFKNSVKIGRSKFGISYHVQCSGDNLKELNERFKELIWEIEEIADNVKANSKSKSWKKEDK